MSKRFGTVSGPGDRRGTMHKRTCGKYDVTALSMFASHLGKVMKEESTQCTPRTPAGQRAGRGMDGAWGVCKSMTGCVDGWHRTVRVAHEIWQVNSGDWLLGDVFLRVSHDALCHPAHSDHVLLCSVQNVYVVHRGTTSSQPPLIGLLSLTDPQTALMDFQSVRGLDPAPPPSVPNRNSSDQWTRYGRIASAVSAVGGFLLGGLVVVVWYKRRPRRATVRW